MAEQVLLNNEMLIPLENIPASCFEDSPLPEAREYNVEMIDTQNAHNAQEQQAGNVEESEGVLEAPEGCNEENEQMRVEREEAKYISDEMQMQTDGGEGQSSHKDDEGVQPAESVTTPTEEGYIFKCVFCEITLTSKDRPKILECLHNACGACIDQKLLEIQDPQQDIKEVYCRICGFYMDPKNIIENQFLNDASSDDANKFDDIKCSSCSDEAPASSWCVDCSEFICDNCVQAHQRLKITKDHTIKHKDEGIQEQTGGNTGETPLYCSMHPHERLSLFCENCDKLTCRDCQLTEHRDHKYKFTHEIAADCRKVLNSMLTDISYKRILLSSAMKVIDDRQGLINEKKQSLVQQITQLVVRLTNTITQRGKQLVSRLNEISESKHKTLDEKKVALDHLSQMTDHCILFTRNVLDFGNDNALLYSKRHLANHLQRIKSRRADIPNPEIPVRIDLALEKVSDIIKVIGGIGQIIVDGRVYPANSQSPSIATPQNSPSPGLPGQPGPHVPHVPNQQPPQGQGPPIPQQMNNNPYIQQQQQQQQRMMAPYQMQQQYQNVPNQNQMMQQQHNMGHSQMKQHQTPIQNLSKMQQQQVHGALQVSAMNALSRLSQGQHMHRVPHMPPQQPPQQLRQPNMPPQMHARMPGPPMNQQVSSSTHPQTNLRTLLQPNGNNAVYIQTGPNQYQAVQPQYVQHYQNRAQGPAYRPQQQQQQPPAAQGGPLPMNNTGARYPYPTQRPPAYGTHPQAHMQQNRPNFPMPPGGKWHIPQAAVNADGAAPQKYMPATPTLNSNYKIMLKPQHSAASVTSTNPKTPSPNSNYLHNDTNPEKSLDKFCEESVNDLMATIAKLDSNGVQVLAENRAKGSSPHVDSSTGDVGGKKANETLEKDDPNEDWCAVCMDGGELVCCDKCPKVFHQFCHIPNLSVEESDTWQCLLCLNFADIPDTGDRVDNDLSPRQRKLAERIILELYCQYELSLPFREIIGQENQAYHEVITSPIALDTIRQKLDWNRTEHYKSLEELVKDVRLMFKNARLFNAVDSQVYSDASNLEKFFDEQLEKWLPEYAYEMFEDEDDAPPAKKNRQY